MIIHGGREQADKAHWPTTPPPPPPRGGKSRVCPCPTEPFAVGGEKFQEKRLEHGIDASSFMDPFNAEGGPVDDFKRKKEKSRKEKSRKEKRRKEKWKKVEREGEEERRREEDQVEGEEEDEQDEQDEEEKSPDIL